MLLLLAVVFVGDLSAQNRRIDSLRSMLNAYPAQDSNRLSIYLKLAEANVYFNRDSMFHYALLGKDLANELELPYQYLYAMQREGVYYYASSEWDTAMSIFRRGLRLSKLYKLPERESAFLGNIGICIYQMGGNDSALYYLEKAFETDKARKDTLKMIVRLSNLGAVQLALNRPAESLRSTHQSLRLSLAVGQKQKAAVTANNIAVLYQRYDSREKAIEYFNIALENMDTNNLGRMALLSNIGELFLAQGNRDSAWYYYYKALKSPRENDCDLASTYAGLIDIALREQNVDTATYFDKLGSEIIDNCKDSANLFHFTFMSGRLARRFKDYDRAREKYMYAKSLGNKFMAGYRNMFQDLSLLEEATGNYEEALRYAKRYTRMNEQYYEARYNREVARTDLEVTFEDEKRTLLANQESMEEDLTYFEDLRVVWTIASIFFLIAILVLFRSYRKGARAAAGLRDLNATITQQKENLQHKSEQLAVSNERIKELSDFRERLAAMAVHDMKGPLSMIIGLSDGEQTPKKQRLIKKAGHQMLNFLMDLLDIYKFEKASIALKLLPHSVDSLFDEALQSVDYLAEEKNIKIIKEIPQGLIVPVDEGILIRVLINILSNAIKYSPIESAIIIKVEAKVEEGRPYLLSAITDHGKGLSEEELAHMFKPMDLRKDNYISKSTSTGIGLDFCKLAIQAHRGKIWAESEKDSGTSVYISLPLHEVIQQDLSPDRDREGPEYHKKDLSAFQTELQTLLKCQIHEAGKVLPILQKMEDNGADQKWVARVKATVYSGDDKHYREIILKAMAHEL